MMIRLMLCLTLAVLVSPGIVTADDQQKEATATKDVPKALAFKMKSLDGKDVSLDKYAGKVVMVVNVASRCGLTPQYEQLQAMHKQYGKQGLAIVGVPCNQFGGQEPGSAKQIQQFCAENYGVEFDMLEKVDVNGDKACDLYKYLTSLDTKPKGSGKISWNFEKFLINRDGKVVARFAPGTRPNDPKVIEMIKMNLEAKKN